MSAKPSPKTKPNIRMVAAHVQLSPATVSLALRGSESIAAETRERVLAAARELNYTPAPRGQRSTPLAVPQFLFVSKDFEGGPTATNPFHGEILKGAEEACNEQGARLTFFMLPESDQADAQIAQVLTQRRPEGVLLVGAYARGLVEQIIAASAGPVVLVDNVMPGLPCDSIMADDFGGAQLATRHLIAGGHRQIAALVGNLHVPSFAARYRGYCAACEEVGLAAALPTEATWERVVLATVLKQILARKPRPSAIFCVTDAHAVFVMEILQGFGLHVPDDISVVGFDNFPIARMAHPPLTTVQNHPHELGLLGIHRLLARINGDRMPYINIGVTTQLIIRDSTRAL